MRPAFIYDAVFPWEKGGAQKCAWELARRLADANVGGTSHRRTVSDDSPRDVEDIDKEMVQYQLRALGYG
jgi:hypothetical protein